MADKPKKKKRDSRQDEKPTILKTDDELMDDLFGPDVREKLKEVAHEHRPKESNDD